MSSPHKEQRPSGETTEALSDRAGKLKSGSIIAQASDRLADLDALAAHVDGAFVVVVKSNGLKYRRRCYLTAKAAEDAVRRASQRGENAVVYLAELRPLWRVVA